MLRSKSPRPSEPIICRRPEAEKEGTHDYYGP
jgi:hypothetical protein